MPERKSRLTRERAAHLAGLVCPHSLYHHDADTLAPALIELVEGIGSGTLWMLTSSVRRRARGN
jgi:hypothetical protein